MAYQKGKPRQSLRWRGFLLGNRYSPKAVDRQNSPPSVANGVANVPRLSALALLYTVATNPVRFDGWAREPVPTWGWLFLLPNTPHLGWLVHSRWYLRLA